MQGSGGPPQSAAVTLKTKPQKLSQKEGDSSRLLGQKNSKPTQKYPLSWRTRLEGQRWEAPWKDIGTGGAACSPLGPYCPPRKEKSSHHMHHTHNVHGHNSYRQELADVGQGEGPGPGVPPASSLLEVFSSAQCTHTLCLPGSSAPRPAAVPHPASSPAPSSPHSHSVNEVLGTHH